MKIKEIIIGKRIRKDMGNLNSLVESIKDIGLLHPIIINEKNELICGRRRLEALRNLGIDELNLNEHYRVFKIEDALRGEFEENFCRKDFTPIEAVEIYESAESYQFTGKPLPRGCAESAQPLPNRKIERVAKSLGVGKEWLREAKAVKDSGRKDLVEQMDEGAISVHKAYEELNKNRIPDSIAVNMDTYDKIINGKKTQITKRFGNWKKNDTAELRIHKAGQLKITDVFFRFLKDYTDEDAIAEGFKDLDEMKKVWKKEGLEWRENDKMIILKIKNIE